MRVVFAGKKKQRKGADEGCECSISGGLKLSLDWSLTRVVHSQPLKKSRL